jgi:hypothetical protein
MKENKKKIKQEEISFNLRDTRFLFFRKVQPSLLLDIVAIWVIIIIYLISVLEFKFVA